MPKVALSHIESTLRERLGSFVLDHVEIEEGFDHDGEASIFVTAVLQPGAPPMPGAISSAANVSVAKAMSKVGDERLSYLYIRRPDDERSKDDSARSRKASPAL